MPGFHRLGQLWVHGAVDTRMNHTDFWVRNNEYKKLGCKKPGLRMCDFFVIFFFVGDA